MTTEPTSTNTEADVESTEADESTPTKASTPRMGLQAMLTRESDMASRRGFRNPPNARSKAQAAGKKKKR